MVSLQDSYLNMFEGIRNRYKSSAFYTDYDWNYWANQGALESYASYLQQQSKMPSISFLEQKYHWSRMTPEYRQLTFYRELNADRNEIKSYNIVDYDSDGNEITKKVDMTEYDYYGKIIGDWAKYEDQKIQYEALNTLREQNSNIFNDLYILTLRAGTGVLKGVMPLINLVSSVTSGLGAAVNGGNFNEAFRADMADDSLFGVDTMYDEALDFVYNYEYENASWIDENGEYKGIGKHFANAAESLGQMLPSIALGQTLNAAGVGNKVASAVQQSVYYGANFAGSLSTKFADPSYANSRTSTILFESALTTALDYGVEKLSANLFGASAKDQLVLGLTGGKKIKNVVLRIAKEALQEGLEEVVQETTATFSSNLTAAMFHDDAFYNELTWQQVTDAFMASVISSVAMTGLQSSIKAVERELAVRPEFKKLLALDQEYESLTGREKIQRRADIRKTAELVVATTDAISAINAQAKNDADTKTWLEGNEIVEGLVEQAYATFQTITRTLGNMTSERAVIACARIVAMEQAYERLAGRDARVELSDKFKSAETMEKVLKHLETLNAEKAENGAEVLTGDKNISIVDHSENGEFHKQQSDIAKQTAEKAANDNIELILTDTDGVEVVDGIMFASEVAANKHTYEDLLKAASRSKLVKKVIKSLPVEITDKLLEIYSNIVGKSYANKTKMVTALLFDSNFLSIALHCLDTDIINVLNKLPDIVSTLDESDDVLRVEFDILTTEITENVRKALRIYYADNTSASAYYQDLTVLTDDDKKYIAKVRFLYDTLYKVVLDGERVPSQYLPMLKTRVNGMNIPLELKQQYLRVLEKGSSAEQLLVLNKIDAEYNNLFKGKYNDHVLLSAKTPAAQAFNVLLTNTGLTVDQVLQAPDNLKIKIAEAYSRSNAGFTVNLFGTAPVFKEVLPVPYNEKQSLYEQLDGDKLANDAIQQDSEGYNWIFPTDTLSLPAIDDLYNSSVSPAQKAYVRIDDILANPQKYLDKKHVDEILKNYGHVNSYTTYLYINNYLVSSTDSKYALTKLDDGTVVPVEYRYKNSILNSNTAESNPSSTSLFTKAAKSKNGVPLKEFINAKLLTGASEECTVKVITLSDQQYSSREDAGFYDIKDNVIIVYAPERGISNALFKYILLHEFQHVVQHSNGFIQGLDYSRFSPSVDLVKDIYEHYPGILPTDFSMDKYLTMSPVNRKMIDDIVVDFIYRLSGDLYAYGQSSIAKEISPIIARQTSSDVTLQLPWGTTYTVSSDGKVEPKLRLQVGDDIDTTAEILPIDAYNDFYTEHTNRRQYDEARDLYNTEEYKYWNNVFRNKFPLFEKYRTSMAAVDNTFTADERTALLRESSKYKEDMLTAMRDVFCPGMELDEFKNLQVPIARVSLTSLSEQRESPFVSASIVPMEHSISTYCAKVWPGRTCHLLLSTIKAEDVLAFYCTDEMEVFVPYDAFKNGVDVIANFTVIDGEPTTVLEPTTENKLRSILSEPNYNDNYIVHAGDISYNRGTTESLERDMRGADTGLFVNGIYGTDFDHSSELTTSIFYKSLPLSVIDIRGYKLLKPAGDVAKVREFFRLLTSSVVTESVDYDQLYKFYSKNIEYFAKKPFTTLVKICELHYKKNKDKPFSVLKNTDSISKVFLKHAGYEGINMNGTKYANTTYGTVIFSVKPDTVVFTDANGSTALNNLNKTGHVRAHLKKVEDIDTTKRGFRSGPAPKRVTPRGKRKPVLKSEIEGNLKYYKVTKDGYYRYLTDGAKKFVQDADLDRVHDRVAEAIKAGKSERDFYTIFQLVGLNEIDDYTFDLYNKHLYKNYNVLTKRELSILVSYAPYIYAMGIYKDAIKQYDGFDIETMSGTVEEWQQLINKYLNRPDSKLRKSLLIKANEFAGSFVDKHNKSQERQAFSSSYLSHSIMKYFDGTISSILEIYGRAKMVADEGLATVADAANGTLDGTVARTTKASVIMSRSDVELYKKWEEVFTTIVVQKQELIAQKYPDYSAKKRRYIFERSVAMYIYNLLVSYKLSNTDIVADIIGGKLSKNLLEKAFTNAADTETMFNKLLNIIQSYTKLDEGDIYDERVIRMINREYQRARFVQDTDYKIAVEQVQPVYNKKRLADQIRQRVRIIERDINRKMLPKLEKINDGKYKDWFDKDTLKINRDVWVGKTGEQRNDVLEDLEYIQQIVTSGELLSKSVQNIASKLEKQTLKRKEAEAKLKSKNAQIREIRGERNVAEQEVKTLKKKVHEMEFNLGKGPKIARTIKISNDVEAPSILADMLNTAFSKYHDTAIQYIAKDGEQNIEISMGEFFEQTGRYWDKLVTENRVDDIKAILDYFSSYSVTGDDNDVRILDSLMVFIVGEIYDLAINNKINIPLELVEQTETLLDVKVRSAATILVSWRELLKKIRPEQRIAKALLKKFDVDTESEVQALTDALLSGDMDKVTDAERNLADKLLTGTPTVTRTEKILHKMYVLQRTAMLSNPGTWVRNILSNVVLSKGINPLSDIIGKLLVGKKGYNAGQLNLTSVKVTADSNQNVKEFIKTELYDSGLMNLLADSLYKFNPMTKNKTVKQGVSAEEELASALTEMIVNATQQRVSKTFDADFGKNKAGKIISQAVQFVYRANADDAMYDPSKGYRWNDFIGTSFRKYLEQIIVLKKLDITKGFNNTQMLSAVAEAYSLSTYEYMHRRNFLSDLEQDLAKRSKSAYYIYKIGLAPFLSTSLNWFNEMLDMSPIGLVRTLINFTKFEKTIEKYENKLQNGERIDLPIELQQMMLTRRLGKGIIGTFLFGVGMLLGWAGIIDTDEDDYGKIKIKCGDYTFIDVSNLFGTSSILVGAQLTKRSNWEKFDMTQIIVDALNYQFEDFVFTTIINNYKQYDSFDKILTDYPYTIINGFIPNIVKSANKLLYNREFKYSSGTFWKDIWGNVQRLAVNLIPGIGYAMPYKVDPYTGKMEYQYRNDYFFEPIFMDLSQSLSPIGYKSYDLSTTEKVCRTYGINKQELQGKYKDLESLGVSHLNKITLNNKYGTLNDLHITEFVNGKTKYTVEVTLNNGKTVRKSLYYKDMNADQRKGVLNRIMEQNAEIAKIYTWTSSGHKYYCGREKRDMLIKYGITNVFIGDKGFVK